MQNGLIQPIRATTKLCAVLGHPIAHSASPAMHNTAFTALGLDWRYVAFDVPPEKLPEAIRGAAALGFVGLNLTVPHKLIAFRTVDLLDPSAEKWEAVNTIRFELELEPEQWVPIAHLETIPNRPVRAHGFNTDADAIVQALREDLNFDPAGKRILITGTGGAGQTAALRLAEEPIRALYLINRTRSKAEALAERIHQLHPHLPVKVGYPEEPIDLLINATSLGLKPEDPLPIDTSRLPLSQIPSVYDMIYNPPMTPLLRAAAEAGCRYANGLGMLLYQGAKALEIWTERPAPIQVMRQALQEFLYGASIPSSPT